MGTADVFAMGPEYRPAEGMRRFLSGTPPIVGMLAMQDTLAMIEDAGIDAIRAKSVALTEFAVRVSDAVLAPLGVTVASPRDPAQRGGHVTLSHPVDEGGDRAPVDGGRHPRLPRSGRPAHRALAAVDELRRDACAGLLAVAGSRGARRALTNARLHSASTSRRAASHTLAR